MVIRLFDISPVAIVGWLWLAWLAGWWLAAIGTKKTQWRESAGSMASHRVPLWAAALLMVAPQLLPTWLRERFIPASATLSAAGLAFVVAGLLITIWARVYLGGNWSGSITVKQGHSLVRTGPYRYVRHPIYTGLLVAVLGTLLVVSEWRTVIAAALAVAALVVKSRLEEVRMRQTFPDYDDYRRHTAAIVPLIY